MVASYGVTELEWDEELDLKRYPLWILWPQFVPLVRPLYVTYSPPALTYATRYACEMLQTPGNKGFDTRLIDGYAYMTSMITTEEERKQREPLFRERLVPFIEDFGKEWHKYRDEMSARFQPLKEAELEKLSDTGLMLYFDEYLRVNQRFWDVHFYLFWAVLPIYILFEISTKSISRSGSNSSRIELLLEELVELIDLIPGSVPMTSSTGRVICLSTSSGLLLW